MQLEVIYSALRGEARWPPLAMFRGMLLAIWHDLSDVKLADALDDRASFRRLCGFVRTEPTAERMAFVRFRRELLRHGLDQALFDEITTQLKSKAIRVKIGRLVDATVVGSASENDEEARGSGHRSRKAIHGYKAHVGGAAGRCLCRQRLTRRRVQNGGACPRRQAACHHHPCLGPEPGRGLAKAHLQALFAAIAYNLERTRNILMPA